MRAPETPPTKIQPGDEAAPGTPQTAEDVCPRCGGSGQADQQACGECGGTGFVTVNLGDA